MTNQYGNELLHRVLLSAMQDIDRICRENGLRYYLHAGTLLGAVNHQGFIPWDDDVDITMMRSDYDRFAEIVQKDYGDRYFLQTYQTDPSHKNNRGVLRILGTQVIHYHGGTGSAHRELGLDIVPLYSVPDALWKRKLQQGFLWILDAAVQIKQGDIVPQNLFMKGIGILSKMGRVTLGKAMDWAMMLCKKETKQVGVLCYTGKNPYTGASGYENDIMPREWYQTPLTLPFEDSFFMTISHPEEDLDRRYGPHWREPYPEEKRVTKHDVKSYEIEPWVLERIL